MVDHDIVYDQLADLLHDSGFSMSLAELHGGLCGALSAGGPGAAAAWLEQCLDESDHRGAPASELTVELERLARSSWLSLTGSEMEFVALLPADDTGLEERATALALWCHGFLSGLVIGGFDRDEAARSGAAEVDEIIQDFAEISKAGVDGEAADSESSEVSYTELAEYVRVSVQLVFEALEAATQASDGRSVH